MKHSKTILYILLTVVAIYTCWPLNAQTKLYNQYKHRTDMTVMCVMDFPLTPDIKTDITMFVPKTKEAVYYLAEEFNLGIEKDIIDKMLGNENNNKLRRYNVYKDNVKKRYGAIESPDDYKNISKLVYSYSKGTIVVFHNIDTEERGDVVGTFLTNTLTEPEKFPSIDNANNKK